MSIDPHQYKTRSNATISNKHSTVAVNPEPILDKPNIQNPYANFQSNRASLEFGRRDSNTSIENKKQFKSGFAHMSSAKSDDAPAFEFASAMKPSNFEFVLND